MPSDLRYTRPKFTQVFVPQRVTVVIMKHCTTKFEVQFFSANKNTQVKLRNKMCNKKRTRINKYLKPTESVTKVILHLLLS